MKLNYQELWVAAHGTAMNMIKRLGLMELELDAKQAEVDKLNQEISRLRGQVHQFSFDELTGLPGRRLMEELFDKQLAVAKRANFKEGGNPDGDLAGHLCVLVVDLDKFKSINDNYGHDGGDQVLKWFALVIRENIRHSDIGCRFGGDEFVIVLPRCKLDDAVVKVAKKLGDSFIQLQTEAGQKIISTLSVGIACLANVNDTVETLIKQADDAMYKAKKLIDKDGCTCFAAAGDGIFVQKLPAPQE
ncbi:MAG: GGDEF domain-containing protein [Parcubacteria group bacterium]